MPKTYTGIGSRDTPDEILREMSHLSYTLARLGFTLRSGGADGADTAFQVGAGLAAGLHEIYVPWKGFNDNPYGTVFNEKSLEGIAALRIASCIHPAWNKCNHAARLLHARNVFQVLGQDLSSKSDFLVCWAPTKNGSITGGTRTAWELAKRNDIVCFNLADPEITKEEILKYATIL